VPCQFNIQLHRAKIWSTQENKILQNVHLYPCIIRPIHTADIDINIYFYRPNIGLNDEMQNEHYIRL